VERWHYLGYSMVFGHRQASFIQSGRCPERPLGCAMYAAAAWKIGCRDAWIGWTAQDRKARLSLVANNARLLILPWIRIRNLASRALALSAWRIGADWEARYGFRMALLESFVDRSKFDGASYRAANWLSLGMTAGANRTFRTGDPLGPPKEVFVYPLRPDFRAVLRG